MRLVQVMVMIAKLERTSCLIVYFALKTYCCDIAHSAKTNINKIYLQMLVQRLRGANLICSFRRFFQPDQNAVYRIIKFSLEVRKDLANISYVTKKSPDNPLCCIRASGNYSQLWRLITVGKNSYTQQSSSQTAPLVKILCSYLTQKNFFLIRLFFIQLPLQQESGA
jgi:hypothetical protein